MPDQIRDRQAILEVLNYDVALEHGAIFQYLTHAYALGEGGLGAEIINIARSEMRHLKYLGERISELGGTVSLDRTGYRLEAASAEAMMLQGLQAEQDAIDTYRAQIERLDDAPTQRLIERIVGDEEFHHGQWEGFAREAVREALTASFPSSGPATDPQGLSALLAAFETEYNQLLVYLRHYFEIRDWHARDVLLEHAIWRMKHMGLMGDEIHERGADPAFGLDPHPVSGSVAQRLDQAWQLEEQGSAMYQRLSGCPISDELKALFKNALGHDRFQAGQIERLKALLAATGAPAPLTVGPLIGEAER